MSEEVEKEKVLIIAKKWPCLGVWCMDSKTDPLRRRVWVKDVKIGEEVIKKLIEGTPLLEVKYKEVDQYYLHPAVTIEVKKDRKVRESKTCVIEAEHIFSLDQLE